MSTLAANALITVDEYNDLSDVDKSNLNLNKDRIISFINSASQFIENWCNRMFITPSAQITEYFTGDGTDHYYVKHARIADAAVTDLELAYRTSQTNWTVISQTTYPMEMDADKGLVFLTNLTFHTGSYRNWRIKYKYGWTQSNLPDDIKLACAELVRRGILLLDGKEGLDSESFGDSSTTYNLATALTDNIKQVLQKYRRVIIG